VVAEVTPNTAAARAGIEPGDVIIAVDGDPIHGAADLRTKIGLLRISETVRLTIRRDGEERDIEITIAAAAGEQ
jgi:serine protease DegQ